MDRVTPGTLGLRVHVEALRAAALAAAVALPLAAFGPPAGDLPAHLYRTFLVQEGVLVWDNFWYEGHYPLASYSLLYYFPAALVGNETLALVAVVVSAALFASIVEREWGRVGRWAVPAFAVAASGPLFTGTYPYALGLAASLGSLRALQADRPFVAVLCAALTAGFSPLAFLFLCLALLAVALARRRWDRRTLGVAAGVAAAGGLQAAAVSLFPHETTYPFFQLGELAALLALCGAGAALALRGANGRVLAVFFALWAAASVLAFLVPSPVGENVTRLRGIAVPLIILAAALARFRPYWLAGIALAGALAYTLVPYVAVIPHRTDTRSAEEDFWEPALSFLRARASPDFRVEVVPTGDHWEAYWLPRNGFPLARGWYRQLDIAQNRLFYREPLEARDYREWMRSVGVRYVVLPDTQLGRLGEEREADLLRSGGSGLVEAFRSSDLTIYELPDATPILTGPGAAGLSRFGHDRIAGWTQAAGSYRLAVRFTPYWRVEQGAVCLDQARDGMTRLEVRRPGPFVLEVASTRDGC